VADLKSEIRNLKSKIPVSPSLSYEFALWQDGLALVAGLDEAGRGAWAGPVAAAAVILAPGSDLMRRLDGVRDSKLMTPLQRAAAADRIRALALTWGIGFASAQEIDAVGILPATRLAMQRALAQLAPPPQHLLLDAVRLPDVPLPQTALIKGDRRVLSIAAASVLAKTARDAHMAQLEQDFPGYGFGQHKGYGTAAHRAALQVLGACGEHRKSFRPIAILSS
jgi:ribonuclease HII